MLVRCISCWETIVKYEIPQLLGQKKHQGNISVISDNLVVNKSKQDFLSVGPAGTAPLTAGKWPPRNSLLEKKFQGKSVKNISKPDSNRIRQQLSYGCKIRLATFLAIVVYFNEITQRPSEVSRKEFSSSLSQIWIVLSTGILQHV